MFNKYKNVKILGECKDITNMSSRKQKFIVDHLFKNNKDEIDHAKIKLGLYWKKYNIDYKYQIKNLEIFHNHKIDKQCIFEFGTQKNTVEAVVNHPTFVIEFMQNGNLNIIYFTRTHGNSYNFVYFDIKKNRIFIDSKSVNTIELSENFKIGGLNIISEIESSMEINILKKSGDFVYYDFTNDLNFDTIVNSDEIVERDKEVLLNILNDYNCGNFEEVKIKLLDDIYIKANTAEIPLTYNNVDLSSNKEAYNNLSDIEKQNILEKREEFVSLFLEIIERIIK